MNLDINGADVPRVCVGGIVLTALSRIEWAEWMRKHCLANRLSSHDQPMVVFSANGQTIATCHKDKAFHSLITQADAVDVDGQPAVIASKLLTKTPLPERVATTDFFHDAAAMAQENGLNFYFLGATQESLDTAVAEIRKQYPALNIVGFRNGYFSIKDEPSIIDAILASKADVLWIGLGVPKQEEFVIRNRHNLKGIGWVKTCGGLFDHFSPDIKRAPKWMQKCCLEWFFRMLQEPSKFAYRYLTTNFVAAWLLLTKTHEEPHNNIPK